MDPASLSDNIKTHLVQQWTL